MQLYAINDTDFADWIASDPSEEDLKEARAVLAAKRENLWTPGHEESFYRDRYERDHRYAMRLRSIDAALGVRSSERVVSFNADLFEAKVGEWISSHGERFRVAGRGMALDGTHFYLCDAASNFFVRNGSILVNAESAELAEVPATAL